MAVSSIRRASQDEQEVGEAVQVDERERVHVVRTRGRECLALGPSAQCSGDVEPRGGLATTRQDEALQLGEVGVEAVAATLNEEVDTLVDVVEPYLLKVGFLKRTARGRELTDAGLKHIKAGVLPDTATQKKLF